MQVRILWARPGESLYSPGDVLDVAALEKSGVDASDLIARGEAEAIKPAAKPKTK